MSDDLEKENKIGDFTCPPAPARTIDVRWYFEVLEHIDALFRDSEDFRRLVTSVDNKASTHGLVMFDRVIAVKDFLVPRYNAKLSKKAFGAVLDALTLWIANHIEPQQVYDWQPQLRIGPRWFGSGERYFSHEIALEDARDMQTRFAFALGVKATRCRAAQADAMTLTVSKFLS